jgi:putative DNA primase/helicase
MSDIFWNIAASYTALCFNAVVLLAALVVGYFPLLKYFPVIGPYVPVARLVAILVMMLMALLVRFRMSGERKTMTNLRPEIEAQTEAAANCGIPLDAPADKPAWLTLREYGGMSPQAAECSYRAGQKRRNEEKAFEKDQLFRAIPAAAPGVDAVTEDSAALVFRDKYKGHLLYDHDLNAWFVWDGQRWRFDKTMLAFEYARQLSRELTRSHFGKSKRIENGTTFAAGVEKFARSDRAFAVDASEWDPDLFLLGTPGGTVNLRDGSLQLASPESRITRLTAVSPAGTGDCPVWLSFLSDATGSDQQGIRFLQQLCGYALTGSVVEHAMAFVYGAGGNGKSVFINTASSILGEYATSAAMDTFTSSKNDKHPTELARLRGARLVTASETEKGHSWAEARIKALTGGDRIAARFMRQDFFEFTPQFKLIVVGNHKPTLANVDDAIKRRFNIIPFTRKPACPDPQLEQKLKAEWPMILRWMIDGCLDWQKNGLARPDSVTNATAEYFSDQDLLAQWLEEKCDAERDNPHKWDTVADLFASWSVYANEAGEQPGSKKAFNEAMQSRGFHSARGGKGVRTFKGVRLNLPAAHHED